MYYQYLKEKYDRAHFEIHNKGFITYSVHDDYIYGHDFYVKPEYRNKGVGQELGRMIKSLAKQKGIKEIISEVDTLAQNPHQSLMALQAGGFEVVTTRDANIILRCEVQ